MRPRPPGSDRTMRNNAPAPSLLRSVSDSKARRQCSMHSGRKGERALVLACVAGDEEAWDRFHQRFQGIIRRAAAQALQQCGARNVESQAQDVTNEVFATLLERNRRVLASFSGRCSLSTWLTVLARRKAWSLLRRKRPETLAEPERNSGQRSLTCRTRPGFRAGGSCPAAARLSATPRSAGSSVVLRKWAFLPTGCRSPERSARARGDAAGTRAQTVGPSLSKTLEGRLPHAAPVTFRQGFLTKNLFKRPFV